MAITKTRILVLVCYLVTFAAGAIMGVVWSLPEESASGRPRRPFGLALTPEQHERMREIWSETVNVTMRQGAEERDRILRERDQSIRGLLTEEQKPVYDSIYDTFHSNMDAIDLRRRQAFEAANARTREILTEEQRRAFDEMLEQRRENMRRGPGGRPPWRGRREGGRGRPHRHPLPPEPSEAEDSSSSQ